MIPLKNMINDVYAKDISRKIITSFRARQEKGEYLPAFPPYGYVKSKTRAYRYEVDEAVTFSGSIRRKRNLRILQSLRAGITIPSDRY